MALQDDIRKTVFKSVFFTIRRPSLPTMKSFIPMTVSELGLKETSPSDWKTFWAENLTSQIRQECMQNLKILINDFDYRWFNDEKKTMKDLCDYINENQLPAE